MKLKITEKGWDGYTGHIGQVEFKNGVSVSDITPGQAQMLGAILRVEDVDTGENPSMAQKMVDIKEKDSNRPAPNAYTEQDGGKKQKKESVSNDIDLTALDREVLEKIADTEGIKGLREIGDKIGVRSKSIEDLIEGILAIRAASMKVVEVEEQPAPVAKEQDADIAGEDASDEENLSDEELDELIRDA